MGRPGKTPKQPTGLASNVLTFNVAEADLAWQRQTLSRAVDALDSRSTSSEKDRNAAEETLRFLDCPESVRELSRQLTKPGQRSTWNFTAGLLGARNQNLVLKALEDQFTAPDAALTQSYLWLLGILQFASLHAPLPAYPLNDVAQQKEWQSKQAKRTEELNQSDDALYGRAAESLVLKQGAAKASTIAAILMRPDGPHQTIRLPGAQIAEAFPLLDEQQQEEILGTFASRVASPSMRGPLEAILDRPKLSDASLRLDALDALSKIDPERGRARILAEIREPHADSLNNVRSFAICLNSLPDETLPELNRFLAKRLEQRDSLTRDLDAQLIGRYATSAIYDRVRTVYLQAPTSWSCLAADGFMRYFLRSDPDYGLTIFRTKGSSCTSESLNEVAHLKRWPEVQPAFIQRLSDADLWPARDAAEVLGQWGDERAKEALLLRLRTFNRTWKSRASEFRPRVNTPRSVSAAMDFQSELIQSLVQAKGWTLSKEEILAVASLTVTGAP